MLTVKEINEVSFGKAGFSGYKPEDVDNFIDEVVESFTQLLAERDDALQQEAQLDQQVKELTNQVAQLKAKNAELQKKLGILAQKIESYREEEDGIKEAILSAQKIGKDAIQEAKDKAAVMLADAEENAKALLANARDDAAKAAREYAIQVEQKRNELEEMKRQVSAFRVSLLEMYKKHLESINHIPSFRVKETTPVEEAPAPVYEEPQPEPKQEPVTQPEPTPIPAAPVVQPQPEPVAVQKPEPASEVLAEPEEETIRPQAPKQPAKHTASRARDQRSLGDTGLRNKVDFSQEQTQPAPFEDDDLSQVGIDLKAYSNIPESLQREKESHFSHLEFGDDVDVGTNKRRKR